MPSFPLSNGPSGHYLVDALGTPFRIHGEATWLLLVAALQQSTHEQAIALLYRVISTLKAQGVNTLIIMAICHDYEEYTGVTPGSGPALLSGASALPFELNTTGAPYTGTGITSFPSGGTTVATEWAAMDTPKPDYWLYVDWAMNICRELGMFVLFFPCYLGFQGKIEGWAADMLLNSTAQLQAFGTFVGNRYKGYNNLCWMGGGDVDPGSITGLTTAMMTVFDAIVATGAGAASGQLISGHFPVANGLSTDVAAFAPLVTLNACYGWIDDESCYQLPPNGYPLDLPVFGIETTYENDVFGGGSPADVRQLQWWFQLASLGGQIFGNFPVWYFTTGTGPDGDQGNWDSATGTLSEGHYEHLILGQTIELVDWWLLTLPNEAGLSALVLSGNGTFGGDDWIVAAADPAGSAEVAYVPDAHSGAFTLDTSFLSAPIRARWVDVTSGAQQTAAGSPYPAGASRSFTIPGANAAGQHDWTLVLDRQP